MILTRVCRNLWQALGGVALCGEETRDGLVRIICFGSLELSGPDESTEEILDLVYAHEPGFFPKKKEPGSRDVLGWLKAENFGNINFGEEFLI